MDQPRAAHADVWLDQIGCRIKGPVVGDDHEVDARREVETKVGVDDVFLVPDQQRHDELHATPPAEKRWASTVRNGGA